jgi:hypothetical protein
MCSQAINQTILSITEDKIILVYCLSVKVMEYNLINLDLCSIIFYHLSYNHVVNQLFNV